MQVKKSRWTGPEKRKNASAVQFPPRYTEEEFNHILYHYREEKGWHKGARVRRANRTQ